MIGLSESVYWTSWAILIVGKGLVLVVILTLATHFGNIFPKSNALILAVLFLLFSVVCCAYSFLATAFFSKARLGAIVGYLIFLFTLLLGISVQCVSTIVVVVVVVVVRPRLCTLWCS